MTIEFPTRAVAACFSLSCFGVAMISGMVADRSASGTLGSALIALVIGHVVGLVAAHVLAQVMGEAISADDAPGAGVREVNASGTGGAM